MNNLDPYSLKCRKARTLPKASSYEVRIGTDFLGVITLWGKKWRARRYSFYYPDPFGSRREACEFLEQKHVGKELGLD